MQQLLDLVQPDGSGDDHSASNAAWNAANSTFYRVPLDVRLMIWSMCERGSDLLSARLTCQLVGLKDLHVRSRFWALWSEQHLRRGSWLSYSLNCQAPPAPAASALRNAVMRLFGSDPEPQEEADMAGFCAAMRNHVENARCLRAGANGPPRANSEMAWKVNKPDGASGMLGRLLKPAWFVPIFGDALETTARRLVYRLMWGTDKAQALFPVTGVFPGTGGMGGGVSFSVGKRTMNLAPFYSWKKGALEMNAVMTEVCKTCNGLCFVVDDSVLSREDDELAQMRNMLHTLLSVSCFDTTVLFVEFGFHSVDGFSDCSGADSQLCGRRSPRACARSATCHSAAGIRPCHHKTSTERAQRARIDRPWSGRGI